MTINAADFRAYVVNPALAALAPAGIPVTKTAADLLMATAAMETDLGTWLTQVGGPALGMFQMQPATLAGLVSAMTPAQQAAVAKIKTVQPYAEQIETNLLLAAALARLFYWNAPAPLPPDTLDGLWGYYKQWWNTPAGAATEADFIAALKLTDIVFS
jgi:hypothetical protein